MDVLVIGIAFAFFVLTWGLVILCDRLRDHAPENNP
jgi:hypothetical protein